RRRSGRLGAEDARGRREEPEEQDAALDLPSHPGRREDVLAIGPDRRGTRRATRAKSETQVPTEARRGSARGAATARVDAATVSLVRADASASAPATGAARAPESKGAGEAATFAAGAPADREVAA